MSIRGTRWAGLVGAVWASLATILSVLPPWATLREGTPQERAFLGGKGLEQHVEGVINPVAGFYLIAAPLWSYIAFVLATTLAVQGRWTRFVAAVGVLLPTAVLGTVLITEAFDEAAFGEPYETQRARIYATVIAVLLTLILAAVVALLCRAYRFYRWFVALFLIGLGLLHLCAFGIIAPGLTSDVHLTVFAWLPGAGYLLAGAFATVAAGAPPASDAHPPPTRLPVTPRTDPGPHDAAPEQQLKSLLVCGVLGVLMAATATLVAATADADQSVRIPDSPGFPTLPGLPTGSPLPSAPPGAPELPGLPQAAPAASSAPGGVR